MQGEIPQNFGNCQKMMTLDLSQNQLTGAIPKELIGLFSITSMLDLSGNQLSGYLPSEVGNLNRIVSLYLSNNRLSGRIPDSLGKCIGLEELSLKGNLFEWVIPASLKSLEGLQRLDMSGNKFSGKIPEYLESFVSLKYLNLSSNNFEGEVPKQGIFKNISAFSYVGNYKLCGGNPLLLLPSCPRIISKKLMLLLILFGVIICAIILGSFLKFLSRRKERNKPSYSDSQTGDSSESPFSDIFHKVSYKELLIATNGFSSKNLVGVGGYGSVYIGILMLSQQITTIVAVKVLDLQRPGALKSFKAECEALRVIRHRNVMKILTSCSSVDYKGNAFKALVYEFMPNGSLENWLHPTANNGQYQRSTNRPLKFIERLNIAIDVASALDYLHRQCQTPIAHCDLKPSNVLLDEEMNGHLGDFGSAKFLLGAVIVNVQSGNHCSTSLIRGSIGYVAPEYGLGRAVSTNGDIYSFGIMLLELFIGRRPTANMFKDGLTLHSFAKTALVTNRVMEIVDHTLVILQNDDDNYDNEKKAKFFEALKDIIQLGVTCSTESPKERMEMELIVQRLQSIKNTYNS